MKTDLPTCPFTVPPFDHKAPVSTARFDWWGWHPLYPRWSRSCWGGPTEEAARSAWVRCGGQLDYYAVKLIKEERGEFTIIEERDCPRLDIWEKIAANNAAKGNPTNPQ